jgi:histidyl-tRNA synthetase
MAITTKPASGMRDFLPQELAKRRYVIKAIQEIYEKYGFLPLETPSIENLSTLLGKYGDEGDQLIFKILHRRDKLARALEKDQPAEKDLGDLGLRYDLTVPLARVVANSPDLPKFFKRYQIQPVWRADRPGKGRYREFLQCDVDVMGTQSLLAEYDVCEAVAEVLVKLGFENFKIHLNHRELLKLIINEANISLEKETEALVAIDKLDKIGYAGVVEELKNRQISEESIEKLVNLIKRPQETDELQELNRLKGLFAHNTAALAILNEIEELYELLALGNAKNKVKIDFSLARGLGYYTGCIFEIRSDAFGGSLGGGGRYDGLIGMFKNLKIPAVGFSIGFERLVLVLEEQGLFKDIKLAPDLLICHFDDVTHLQVARVAHLIREQGIKAEIYPETPKLGRQIAYAETIGANYVGILGATELENSTIALKNLTTGTQVVVPYDQVAANLS